MLDMAGQTNVPEYKQKHQQKQNYLQTIKKVEVINTYTYLWLLRSNNNLILICS